MRLKNTYLIVWFFMLLSGLFTAACDGLFEHSPYSAKVSSEMRGTYKQNHIRLNEIIHEHDKNGRFSFALIADNHGYFDELALAVESINKDSMLSFVIHLGDLVDGGFIKEYESFHTIMARLNKPYFTVIGNHDVLVNGREIYSQIYGKENYSFTFLESKFVFFNNIVLEVTPELPDFEWLEQQTAARNDYNHLFVLSHIPPWDDTYTPDLSNKFKTTLVENGVGLSIHGHHHHPNQYEEKGVTYLVAGAPQMGVYRIIEVEDDKVTIRTVEF